MERMNQLVKLEFYQVCIMRPMLFALMHPAFGMQK